MDEKGTRMKSAERKARYARLEKANDFIDRIATCGRKFLSNGLVVGHFQFDDRGRLWYVDQYANWIWCHGTGPQFSRKFQDGGTMRTIVWRLSRYILNGWQLEYKHLYFPKWASDGDVWDYGEDMEKVRQKAKDLDLLLPAGSPPPWRLEDNL